MSPRWLLALYPSRWRDRYGDEFAALLEAEPMTASLVLDVIRGALDARTAAPVPGGPAMRTRTPALVSVLAALLVLPAATFLAAALVRGLQPVQYQPAHTAQAIFDAFATLPAGSVWLLLTAAPLVAGVLAALAAWRRLQESAAREDVAAFVEGWRRIARQPVLVVAAIVLVVAAKVLLFAIGHAIAG